MRTRILRRKMKTKKSLKLNLRAESIMPIGDNLATRTFKLIGKQPPFIKRASSAFLWDEDRNKYIDYINSHGAIILGHANPAVIKTVRETARNGIIYDAPTQIEIKLAELITKLIPSIEMIQFADSTKEAIRSAIQLACAFTGKSKIMKFEGCHHEVGDLLFSKGELNIVKDNGRVIPKTHLHQANDILNASFNNLESVHNLFRENAGQVAAVIVEPIATSMGCIIPDDGFLNGLRKLCDGNNALLIFDETTTGFRTTLGGAQFHYDVKPDLTILGKIIGGGLFLGAFGGKKEIMKMVVTSGSLNQHLTNPLAMATGFTVLRILQANKMIYKQLETRAIQLEEGIKENLKKLGFGYKFNRVGSMFTLYFTSQIIKDSSSVSGVDQNKFAKYFKSMLEQNVYLTPSQFGTSFISTAHSERIIEKTIKANYYALQQI